MPGNRLGGRKKEVVVKRVAAVVGGVAALAGALVGGYWVRKKAQGESESGGSEATGSEK